MELIARSQEVLGSLVEIKLPAPHAALFPACFRELERIERAFSRFLDDSELARINSHPGVWQRASDEFLSLVERAEEFHSGTDGHFDIALKSVLDELGYDKNYSFKPKIKASERASEYPRANVPSAAFPRPLIERAAGRILLYSQIEFGGLGKGYALDSVAVLLERSGVSHYYVNAGGDIYAKRGEKKKQEQPRAMSDLAPNDPASINPPASEPGDDLDFPPWIVLLEHPDDPSRAIGQIELDGRAIAASAPNRRKWGPHHHLINAKTGLPAQGTKAIFVLARTGIEADAYATALFTAGFEEGIRLSKDLPVEILSISSEDKMYKSKGFKAELYS